MSKYAAMVRSGRAALGISQTELAKRTGVSVPTIARFEVGKNVLLVTFQKIVSGLDGCEFKETADGFVMTVKK